MTHIKITMTVTEGADPEDPTGLDEATFDALMDALMMFGEDVDIDRIEPVEQGD